MLPPKPKVIVSDVKAFFARRERHNWIALLPSIAIPMGIFYVFVIDNRDLVDTDPVVIYAESWSLDRSEAEIRVRQRDLALQADEQRAVVRERFQQMADGLGIDYDREAAAAAERISEQNRQLAERLEEQEAAEESQAAENGAAER